MKNVVLSLAVVFASAMSAQAAEPVSLQAVGLGGMKVMSDSQGSQVRAKGIVWGSSAAYTSTTTSTVTLFPLGTTTTTSAAQAEHGFVNAKLFGPAFGANASVAYAAGNLAVGGGFAYTN